MDDEQKTNLRQERMVDFYGDNIPVAQATDDEIDDGTIGDDDRGCSSDGNHA